MPTTVTCPTCRKTVAWSEAEAYRPFCSERCKLIDLGEWASGSYAIPVEPERDAEHDGNAGKDPGRPE